MRIKSAIMKKSGRSFKLVTSGAKWSVQIHTNMCYSNFNDIIKTIKAMNADAISIETVKTGNKILKIFKETDYG